jgi:AcrR family transcriptional regulator
MRATRTNPAVRREQIAEAALLLINARGLREMSLAAVARRVGLVPSAIYRHFPSKDALLDAVLERIGASLAENLQASRMQAPDPIEALELLLVRHASMIRRNQAIPRLIFADGFSASRPERRRRVLAVVNGYVEGIGDIIQAGQAQGRIRHDIDPRTLAMMFLGLLQLPTAFWYLSDGDFDATAHVKRAWRAFRDMLVAPGQPTRRTLPGSGARQAIRGPACKAPPARRATRPRAQRSKHP